MERDEESGGEDREDGPERTCIVTRRKSDPGGMIRFVLGPDLTVVPDIRRKLPGRGVWVMAHAPAVLEAVKKQAFSRGFKTKALVSPDLAAETDALLERDCLQSLSMANKAGVAVAGFAKTEAVAASGTMGAVLHAIEAGDDGIRKLEASIRRHAHEAAARQQSPATAARQHGTAATAPVPIKLFSSQQLDLALGRTNVIHAALSDGPVCKAFLSRCRRLMLYRSEALPDVQVLA